MCESPLVPLSQRGILEGATVIPAPYRVRGKLRPESKGNAGSGMCKGLIHQTPTQKIVGARFIAPNGLRLTRTPGFV